MRLVSTRNPRHRATFTEAIQTCVPGDGGLYVPEPVPCFRDVSRLLDLDFQARSAEILHRLLGDEFSREELEEVVREAFDFPLPLAQLRERIFVLELFHGPTFAFQDFGCRFLAGMLALVADREGPKPRTVLVATTGDTGAAAAQAFWKRKGVQVVVLHPKGGIPELQERQIGSLGANVLSCAVAGSYDDCQALVARCFEDRELAAALGLTSANSLNVGRILAQTVLFFEAAARMRDASLRDAPVFAVPCGNLGNLCAGLLAQRMGLPAKAFVAATNANDALPRFLATGHFHPHPTRPTLAGALDVGSPASWERLEALFDGRPDALRSALRGGSSSDAQIRKSLWELHAAGRMPEPALAVAHAVLQERLGLTEPAVLLATAHPAKSADLLRGRMNLEPELPPALARLGGLPSTAQELPADFEVLRSELLNRMPPASP